MDDLTALRVADARELIAAVDAADITSPDLPQRTALDLIARLKVTVDILARHAETQQRFIGDLRGQIRRLADEKAQVWTQLAELEEQAQQSA
ncbi:hypothetical protein GCM10009535_12210 [Streptomyces thermocarboxydovorans]|uniref:Uncharacterized protein n=1 Tax=Streptomyces thermocarboxydovorans TaxID=59298 RepID=A0ABP3SG81_9ACTN